MRVAIVHYWFVTWRGGEKVVEQLLRLYPKADVYAHVVDPDIQARYLAGHEVRTTFINRLPGSRKWYQRCLPMMPYALEQLDLSDYDLVISSESGPAKNVLTGPDTVHICYCHSPMRYVWDMYHLYLAQAGRFSRLLMKPLMHYMRVIDSISAARVDHFVANSHFIARRIQKCYRRDSEVIHPPVATQEFACTSQKQDYYLVLGQLTPYKKADLVVDAFILSGKKLIVIGDGEQFESLRARKTPNIEIMSRQPFDVIKSHLANARALIFPGVEDFGIVPLEAMASGTPVIAYARGGALETVVDSPDPSQATGILFDDQSVAGIHAAIDRFEALPKPISPNACRARAEQFSEECFRERIEAFVNQHLPSRHVSNGCEL